MTILWLASPILIYLFLRGVDPVPFAVDGPGSVISGIWNEMFAWTSPLQELTDAGLITVVNGRPYQRGDGGILSPISFWARLRATFTGNQDLLGIVGLVLFGGLTWLINRRYPPREREGELAIFLVDGHMHVGIYSPLAEDAITESKAAAMGGVTSAITYFRTGEYYLNKGGAYKDFYPEVLDVSKGRYWVDYAYHLAPINRGHIDEMPMLMNDFGVSSSKIFMFYGGHGLHGKSDQQHNFLKLEEGEKYDFAHFEFIMRKLSEMIEANPKQAPYQFEFALRSGGYFECVHIDGAARWPVEGIACV